MDTGGHFDIYALNNTSEILSIFPPQIYFLLFLTQALNLNMQKINDLIHITIKGQCVKNFELNFT